jgi:raffinose/stachyose/melibiose transport system substrate-binding protein
MTSAPRRRQFRPAVAVTAVGAAFVMTACSSGGGTSQSTSASSSAAGGDVTITLGTQTAQGGLGPYRPLIDAFQAANPTIKVNLVETPTGDYANVLRTQLQAGNAPDVFYGSSGSGNANSILTSAAGGFAAPLTEYPWVKEAIPEGTEVLFTRDGQLYGMPVDQSPVSMITNLTAYKEVGLEPATTLEEALQQCATVKEKGKSLYALAGTGGPNLALFASQIAASRVYGKDPDWNSKRASNEVTFADSAEWKATLDQIITYKDSGCFQEGVEGAGFPELTNAITSGSSLGIFAPAGAVNDSKEAAPSQDFGAAVLPAATEAETRAIVSPSNALAINAASPNKDAAVKFLEFLAQPANQDAFAEVSGNLSLSEDAQLPASVGGLGDFVTDPEKNVFAPNLTWPNGGVYEALGTGVQGLLTDLATPEDVLRAMDEAWDQGA